MNPTARHLYQILANESGISHVKVSTGYTVTQLLINLLIIAMAGQLALVYQLVVSVGIVGGLAALYIFVKTTCNLKPETCNLKLETCNLKPETCNLKPAT